MEDVEMLVAVDESLGLAEGNSAANRTESGDVGEEIERLGHRAIPYSGTVAIKDVRNALRRYEEELVAAAESELPDEIRPDRDVITLAELADSYAVSESAVENKAFPEHERIGRTLVRPAVLEGLRSEIDSGLAFERAETAIAEAGIDDASAALAALGYRVEWEGLGGGTVRER
jgi:hypothetical protein